MAGRFPLYTDADVHGPLIEALIRRGWDVLRAVDHRPEGTDDPVHFEEAARLGRVLVSNDEDQLLIALEWVAQGRPFAGLVSCRQAHYPRMGVAGFLRSFEDLATRDDPFNYPIVYFKP